MTGDESGDLALALGLFAFLFTVGLCIILRKVPHFVWKRLTASKESLLAYADAVSSPRKLKKSPSLMDSGVTALARSLTLNRRLRVNISEAVHNARYVTNHPYVMTHHPSIAHRSIRLAGNAMASACTIRTFRTPRGLNAPW